MNVIEVRNATASATRKARDAALSLFGETSCAAIEMSAPLASRRALIRSGGDTYSTAVSAFRQSTFAPKLVWNSAGGLSWVAHNYLQVSNNFVSAGWVKTGLTGATNEITETAATGEHRTDQTQTVASGSTFTFSIEVQKNGRDYCYLYFDDGTSRKSFFNINAGTKVSDDAGNTSTIESASGSYFKITITRAVGAASVKFGVGISTDGSTTSYLGSISNTLRVRNAQVNEGPVATDFVSTSATQQSVCPLEYDLTDLQYYIRHDPAATNIALYNRDLTNAAWTAVNITAARTATGIDGQANGATTLTASASDGTIKQAITSTSGTRVTSMYVKRRTGTGSVYMTQDDGTTWTEITVPASAWGRVDIPAVTSTNPTVGIKIATSGDAIDVDFFQHEKGTGSDPAARTAPIPTFATSRARTYDKLTWTGFPTAAAMSVIVDYASNTFDSNGGTAYHWGVVGANANERVSMRADVGLTFVAGGATVASITDISIKASSSRRSRMAFRFATNDFAAARDGILGTLDTSGAAPTITSFIIGAFNDISGQTTKPVKIYGLTILTRAMTDAQLIAATSENYPDKNYFVIDGATYPSYGQTATPTGVYDVNTNKTWVAYEAIVGGLRVTRVKIYDHEAARWSVAYTVGVSLLTNDDHGAPTIARHSDGRWHVFYGGHVTACKHSMTDRPDDPTVWTALSNFGTAISYPRPVLVGSTMYLFVRGESSTRYLSVATVTTAGVVSAFTQLATFTASERWYAGNAFLKPSTTDIHIVGTRGDANTVPLKGVYYLIYKTATGAVTNISGGTSVASGSLPVSSASLDSNFRFVSHAVGSEGSVPNFCFDAAGDPHVVYCNGVTGSGVFDVYHTAYVTGAWTTAQRLGTSWFAYPDACVTKNAGSGVDVYWVQRGRTLFTYAGGDIWKASRTSGGTWGRSAVFRQHHIHALGAPTAVVNETVRLRLTFFENLQVSTDTAAGAGALKGFAYGDSGYVK